jgi:hypothetical protein
LSRDLQEDYWNAPVDMRNYLLKKWGVVKWVKTNYEKSLIN